MLDLWYKQDTSQRGVEREATTTCTPLMEMTVTTVKKHMTMMKICKQGAGQKKPKKEQWQEVISRRDKQKVKRANQASLLRLGNSQNSSSTNIIEVKDRWVKVRVTMDSAAVGARHA